MLQNKDLPNESYKKIVSKFKSALENYERFSFAAFIEFECVLKTAEAYKQQRMFIETEVSLRCLTHFEMNFQSFLREHVGKYLDDDFVLFNNHIKAKICMISAGIYKSVNCLTTIYTYLVAVFRSDLFENMRSMHVWLFYFSCTSMTTSRKQRLIIELYELFAIHI